MTYKEAFKNIRSDYRRYSELYPNGGDCPKTIAT